MKEKTIYKYLLIAAIVLQIVNTVLYIVPFVEWYQPSYSKTVLGQTTYEGWHTEHASGLTIFPLLILLYVLSVFFVFLPQLKKETKKKKKTRFVFAMLASVANILIVYYSYSSVESSVSVYEKYGAYCTMTATGKYNIALSVLMVVLLIALSVISKRLIKANISVNKESEDSSTVEDEALESKVATE